MQESGGGKKKRDFGVIYYYSFEGKKMITDV